jgi:hypothetical protein
MIKVAKKRIEGTTAENRANELRVIESHAAKRTESSPPGGDGNGGPAPSVLQRSMAAALDALHDRGPVSAAAIERAMSRLSLLEAMLTNGGDTTGADLILVVAEREGWLLVVRDIMDELDLLERERVVS